MLYYVIDQGKWVFMYRNVILADVYTSERSDHGLFDF